MTRVRVVVIDQQPAVRQGLVRLLETAPDIELISAVASPAAAIAVVAASAPEVVALDLLMQPLGTGTALVRRFVRPPVAAKVLALAAQDEPWLAQTAIKAGATQFLSKSASLDTLVAALRRLGGGEESPIAGQEVGEPCAVQAGTGPTEDASGARVRLLHYLAAGSSNRTIAHLEGVSERTIKRRISDLYLKLGASHRAGAVAAAMQLGLI